MNKQTPQSVHGSSEKHRKYGAFQNEIYRGLSPTPTIHIKVPDIKDSSAGMLHNRFPVVTTDPNKLEDQAKSRLPAAAYNYVAGGAGERATMDANRLAFRQWKMVPRMLRPTTYRDLTVELFGEKYGPSLTSLPKGKSRWS